MMLLKIHRRKSAMNEYSRKKADLPKSKIEKLYNIYLKLKKSSLCKEDSDVNEIIKESLEKVINETSESPKDYPIKLEAFMALNRYEDARVFLKNNKCNFIDKEYYYDHTAYIFYCIKEKKKALNILSSAIKKYPTSVKLLNNYAYMLDELGNFKLAAKQYRKILEIAPDDTVVRHNLAVTLWHRGINFYEEVVLEFKEVVRLTPQSKKSQLNLGIALACTEKYEEAVGCFDRAIDIDQYYWRAYQQKGKAYFCLNQLEDAMKCWELSSTYKPILSEPVKSKFKDFGKLVDENLIDLVAEVSYKDIFLLRLDLSDNKLEGKYIEDLIKKLPLIYLDLSDNKIKNENIFSILSNSTLTELNLSLTPIDNSVVKEFLKNKTLTKIYLNNIDISESNINKINSHLEKNRDKLALFAEAVLASNFQKIDVILKEKEVSPFAPVEKNLTALEYALSKKNQSLAERLIRGYLQHYQPRLNICKYIAHLLEKYPNVIVNFNLSNLCLNDVEVIWLLSNFLKKSKTLTNLDLSFNLMTHKSLNVLVRELKERAKIISEKSTGKFEFNVANNQVMMSKFEFNSNVEKLKGQKISIDMSSNLLSKEISNLFSLLSPQTFFANARSIKTEIRSIVNPYKSVSSEQSLVHLLGKKEFNPQKDHALMIIEWINSKGQLSIMTAELRVNEKTGKSYSDINICDDIHGLEDRIKSYDFVTYEREKELIKAFADSLKEERGKESPRGYSKYGRKFDSTDNCLTWAINELFDNNIIDKDEKEKRLPFPWLASPHFAVSG
jgi:tetratricopeptide (TPR) repeat protein